MKKRALIVSICALLGLVVIWGIVGNHQATPGEPAKPVSPPQSDTGEVTAPPPAETAAPTSSDPGKQLEAIARARGVPLDVLTQEAKLHLSNMQNEMSKAVNGPIEFYGEVMDENEQPIVGANILLSYVVFPNAQVVTNTVTDVRGAFMLNSVTGAILTVQVQKEGYKENGTNQNSFTYYSPLPNTGFTADKNSPVIFHMGKAP